MTTTAQRHVAMEFALMLRHEVATETTDHDVIELAISLMRLAKRHGWLAVPDCNRNLTDKELRMQTKIEKQIADLTKAHGLHVTFGGDPRGYTVKLILPSGRYNTWGGAEDGWGVPQ